MTAGRKAISINKDWCTPKKLVNVILEFFGGRIDLDPCSSEQSIIPAEVKHLLPYKDGLKEVWDYHTIYVNPPYGNDKEKGTTIYYWIKKCADAHERFGSEVLALIPVAVNTSHWKEYVFGKANSVCFLADTRLKFIINGNSLNKGAPMAVAMVYWGKHTEKFYDIFSKLGAVVDLTTLIKKNWQSPIVNKYS